MATRTKMPTRQGLLGCIGLAAGFFSFLSLAAAQVAAVAPDAGSPDRRQTPIVRLVRENAESVVNISTERVILLRQVPFWGRYGGDFDLFFDEFFGYSAPRRALKLRSIGSGVIVDKDGIIVTNAHVVHMASNIIVVLTDGTSVEGKVVYHNPDQELALIKIEPPKPLKAVTLGQTKDLMVGETAVAIGNPLGLENSVTSGIVSGINREFYLPDGEVVFSGLIQTDAPINPGNSGGALFNINGELIGINMAVVQNYQNIGFAVPVENVRKALEAYRQGDSGATAPAARSDVLFEDFSMPDINIETDADGYTVRVDIAGLNKEKIKVELRDGMMTISAERTMTQRERGAGRTYSARSYSSFLKSFSLPSDADQTRIKTRIEGDTLIVSLPKKTSPKPRKYFPWVR